MEGKQWRGEGKKWRGEGKQWRGGGVEDMKLRGGGDEVEWIQQRTQWKDTAEGVKQRGGGDAVERCRDAVVGWMGCSGEVGDVAGDGGGGGDVVEETHQGMQWRGVGDAVEVLVWLPISPPSSVLPHVP